MTTCAADEWDSDEPIFPVRPISKIMLEVEQRIYQAAPENLHIIIFGESGTGKELVAKGIHQRSSRASQPFVTVNCAEFVETLSVSQLFGHMKGSFSGAITTHRGHFEVAHGGTLFFDEIGDMSPTVQAQLLRATQQMEIQKVGMTGVIPVDLRFIAATNKNLEAEIKMGKFREDLYQRLTAFPIVLPPLRYRKEDLPGLIAYFLDNSKKTLRVTKRCTISDAAQEVLLQHDWQRGNVRELQNVLSAAVIQCSGNTILPEHISFKAFHALSYHKSTADDPNYPGVGLVKVKGSKTKIPRDIFLKVWEECNKNIRLAAQRLGRSTRTVYRMIREYIKQVPEAQSP